MFEYQKILDKIEQLVEKRPYKSVKIEVELQDQTLVLEKDRQRPIGFSYEEVYNSINMGKGKSLAFRLFESPREAKKSRQQVAAA